MWKTGRSDAIGAAYSSYLPSFVEAFPSALDYVEVPFELLQHDSSVAAFRARIPFVLHCASLSIASPSICAANTLERVEDWAQSTLTPWIGEHLAFVTADRSEAGDLAETCAPGEPYNIGYTVSPPMNEETAQRVIQHLRYYASRLSVPMLIENSPLYFQIPSSTMSQAKFMTKIIGQSSAGVLLDLAHLVISSKTMGFDPETELDCFPLENTLEIHISGIDSQADGDWDNHAARAPDIVYRLLEKALQRARPRAITLEYNWSSQFPPAILLDEIERVRSVCVGTGVL